MPILDYDQALTYDEFKNQVSNYYDRHLSKKGKKSDESAFAAFNGTCNKCGEHGHMKFQCTKKDSNPGGGAGGGAGAGRGERAKVKCSYCKKNGHIKKDCYSYARKQQQQGGTANLAEEYVASFVVTAEAPPDPQGNDTFWMDTGSSSHFTPYEEDLFNIRPISSKVVVANKHELQATAIGDMSIRAVTNKGQWVPMLLKNVMLVPDIVHRLLSARKIEDNGGKMLFDGDKSRIDINGYSLPIFRTGLLYGVNFRVIQREKPAAESAVVAVSAETWHQRLGHRNMEDVQKLGSLDIGVPGNLVLKGKCGVCEMGKHKRISFSTSAKDRATEVLGLVHSDLMTVEQMSLGGAKYVVIFTDDFSRYRSVYFMTNKCDTLGKFQDYVSEMRALTGGKMVKAFRSDNGGEYTGNDFKTYCKESGIKQTFSGPHAPQQNGVAERSIGIVEGGTRCNLIQSGLRKGFWAEAMASAVYAINRSPSTALGGDTPYHAFFGKHAKLDHLRPFGCRAYVHVYDEDRKKMDPKAVEGIQMGYHPSNNRCYRVYIPESGSFKYTVHVTHDEISFPAKPGVITTGVASASISEGVDEDTPDPVGADGDRRHHEEETKEENQRHEVETGWNWTDQVQRGADNLGRSRRETRTTMCQDGDCRVRGPHMAHYSIEYACVAAGDPLVEPKSYDEALKSPDSSLWKEAMDAEYKALVDNGTWILCELPPGRKAIGSTWVYKIKYDEKGNPSRYKARFVTQGFSQMPGVDFFETTSPVVKMVCIRTVLAVANQQDWIIENMDFDTAFLQSPVKEEIYVRQPKGYEVKDPGGRT